jgi:4-hydroxy-tetrahydrodipicolinate synthase
VSHKFSKEDLKTVVSALVSPFNTRGDLDVESFEKLLRYQVKAGIRGFVINGTTGESPTLNEDEVSRMVISAKSIVPDQAFLILGTGTNDTRTTVEKTKFAKSIGCNAALVVCPYYNRPPQRGILAHYLNVADQCDFPIILYNVPTRTASKLEFETIETLSKHPNVWGLKEASGDRALAQQLRRRLPKDFVILSGDDSTFESFKEEALVDGIISVASLAYPNEFLSGKISQLKKMLELLSLETNPIPIKYLLSLLGIISSTKVRLPLVDCSESLQLKITSENQNFR